MTEEQLEKIKFFETSIENEKDVSKKIRLWQDYRNHFSLMDAKFSLEIADRACEYAKQMNEVAYMKMLFSKTNSLSRLERYEESFNLLKVCLSYFLENYDRQMIIKILGGMSNIYIAVDLFSHAIYLLDLILNKYITEEDREFAIVTKSNLILLYQYKHEEAPFSLEDIDDMLESYEIKKMEDSHVYSILSLMKARYSWRNGQYNEAIKIIDVIKENAQKNSIYIILIDCYFDMGRIYKMNQQYEDMEKAFLKAIQLSKEYKVIAYLEDLYNELYLYYSQKKMYKKALECLENYNLYTTEQDEKRKQISEKSEELGFYNILNWGKDILSSLFQNSSLEVKSQFFITDLKGDKHNIRIQDIIFAQKNIDILKIQLAIGKPIYSKMNFKDFIEEIESYPFYHKLFFETNMRSQIVNLFWMSNIDLPSKKIFLKSIEKEYEVLISKRQYALLKKHLLKFNLT